ncbi:MAG: hypothetical protein JKY15_08240, partial [Deltaproteobacteria bacterium]|nr:hypothetical protein [Deltaproteobacteria bacterium]
MPAVRRIVDQNRIGEVEMTQTFSTTPNAEPELFSDLYQPRRRAALSVTTPLLADQEMAPIVQESGALDKPKEMVDQVKSSFSARETALNVAGLIPEALKELGHQIPGIGA